MDHKIFALCITYIIAALLFGIFGNPWAAYTFLASALLFAIDQVCDAIKGK